MALPICGDSQNRFFFFSSQILGSSGFIRKISITNENNPHHRISCEIVVEEKGSFITSYHRAIFDLTNSIETYKKNTENIW